MSSLAPPTIPDEPYSPVFPSRTEAVTPERVRPMICVVVVDVDKASRHWYRDPQSMGDALAMLSGMVRENAVVFSGRESQADNFTTFMVTFAHPAHAVNFSMALQVAVAAQAWPRRAPVLQRPAEQRREDEVFVDPQGIRVRIGIHMGPADGRGDAEGSVYSGPAVRGVAKVARSAHGGMTLVTEAAFNELRDRMIEISGASVHQLGRYAFKDAKLDTQIWLMLPTKWPSAPFLKMTLHAASQPTSPPGGRGLEIRAPAASQLSGMRGVNTMGGSNADLKRSVSNASRESRSSSMSDSTSQDRTRRRRRKKRASMGPVAEAPAAAGGIMMHMQYIENELEAARDVTRRASEGIVALQNKLRLKGAPPNLPLDEMVQYLHDVVDENARLRLELDSLKRRMTALANNAQPLVDVTSDSVGTAEVSMMADGSGAGGAGGGGGGEMHKFSLVGDEGSDVPSSSSPITDSDDEEGSSNRH